MFIHLNFVLAICLYLHADYVLMFVFMFLLPNSVGKSIMFSICPSAAFVRPFV